MKGYDYAIKRNTILVKDIKKADRSLNYMLPCGHKNGVIPNVWPFDLMTCIDCGMPTKIVMQMNKL